MSIGSYRLPGLRRQLVLAAGIVAADSVLVALVGMWVLAQTARDIRDADRLLPATVRQAEALPLSQAAVLEVSRDGAWTFNGEALPADAGQLEQTLARYRAAAQAARIPPALSVRPEPSTPYRRVAPVLRACSEAGIVRVRLMY